MLQKWHKDQTYSFCLQSLPKTQIWWFRLPDCLIFSVLSRQGDFPQFLKFKEGGCDTFYKNQEKNMLKFKLTTYFSFFFFLFFSNGSINTDFLSLNLFYGISQFNQSQGSRQEGVKGISALVFWNSALKIKLKGKNTFCSLRFQCWYSINVVKSFILS